MARRRVPAVERATARIIVEDRGYETPCWIFTGATNNHGYGVVGLGGRQDGNALVHVLIYEVHKGPVPHGKVLDHLCRQHPCCRPDHLDPVTQRENFLRGEHPLAVAWRASLCIRGHSLTGDNVRIKDGGRRCRTCQRNEPHRKVK